MTASPQGRPNNLALDTLPLEGALLSLDQPEPARPEQVQAEAVPTPEQPPTPEAPVYTRPRRARRRPLARFAQTEESPGFYLSLSDLMSLLLVFFVLIFSMTDLGLSKEPARPKPKIVQASMPAMPLMLPGINPIPGIRPRPGPMRLGLLAVSSQGSPDPGLARKKTRQAAPPPPPAPPAPKPKPPKALAAVPPVGVDQALLTLVTASKPLPAAALPGGEQSLTGILKKVRESVRQKDGPKLKVESGPRKLVVSLPEAITFDVAQAEIKPSMAGTLAHLARLLTLYPNLRVVVTGHTDDVPIRNQAFASNWELSAARAAAVGRALLEQGLAKDRLSIQGLADLRPKAPNDSPQNRSLNRRVEIELRV